MPLIKDGRVVEDTWLRLEDDAEPEPGTAVIVSLERWQAERETLAGRNAPLGLWLKSDQSPAGVAEDLGHFDLVALEFPKFNDGRAFSYGRLLRERYGFTGEAAAPAEEPMAEMDESGIDFAPSRARRPATKKAKKKLRRYTDTGGTIVTGVGQNYRCRCDFEETIEPGDL